jgi:HAD superfamily hydrolase (TIGR01549 family)
MPVIFDMDGTLLRLDVDIEEVRLRLAARFAPFGVTRPFRPILRRIREAAREAGDPALERAGRAILDEWELRAAAQARPRAGAAEVVAALAARGERLAIVTDNGRACVAAALAAARIPPVFAAIVTRDDVADPKPDPAGVRAAAAALGDGAPWYVGDHPNDIVAGRAAGIRVAALRGGMVADAQLAGADRIIDGLEDVLALPA